MQIGLKLLNVLKTALGAFLRYAYTLNLGTSLRSATVSYYRFGRLLAEIFGTLGLIERAHPWRCGMALARPLDVLSYAWAKTDWRKPFTPATTLTFAITLLLGCGFLATLSTGISLGIGTSQAYASSIFAPTNPGTDLAMKYMSNAFGVTISGVPAPVVDGVVGGFQKMMALYSTAMLIIAGFILLYILLGVIAATAHEGKVGGSGFNTVWAPIRLIVAIGLLVPLPMAAGYNGYNSGQYIVMKVAELGSGLATNLWVPFATALANRGDVIATPNVPAATQSVLGVLRNEFCRVRYEKLRAIPELNMTEKALAIDPIETGASIVYYYKTTDGSGSNSFCGSTQYEKATEVDSLAKTISTAYEQAYFHMRSNVANMADQLNSDGYIQVIGAESPGMGNEEAIDLYIVSSLVTIITAYQNELALSLVNTQTEQDMKATNALSTEVSDAGWAGAALWFNTISRMNSELLSAARGIPSSSPPDLGRTGDKTGAPSKMSAMIQEGLDVLNQRLNNLQALMKQYGYDADSGSTVQYGAGTVKTSSVVAGLPPPSTGFSLSGGVGSFLSWVFESKFGGPFSIIGTGAESNLSTINPLAQLAQIGNWLIDKSMILLALAWGGSAIAAFTGSETLAAFTGGISALLTILGMVGFGAGILLMYVTPLLPFVRFMFGVAGWLINILEAIIAIPLVAIAHLNTSSSGISGDMARRAYFMIFSIFLRPALLIVGLVVSLMMFIVSIGILNDMYKAAVLGFMGTSTGGAGGGFSIIMYTVMYVGLAYGLCNLCFKLIEEIPNHAMNWIGQASSREIHQDEDFKRAMTHTGGEFINLSRTVISTPKSLVNKS